MSLRFKTISAILITLTLLLGVIYNVSQKTILEGFSVIETDNAKENIDRLRAAIGNEMAALQVKFIDWSQWNDTYAYMEERNADYLASNLPENALADMKINLFLLFDQQRQLVYGRLANLDNQTTQELPLPLLQELQARPGLFTVSENNEIQTGIIMLSGLPHLITTQAILTSEKQGPARGYLMAGIAMTPNYVEKIAKLTQLNLKMALFDQAFSRGEERWWSQAKQELSDLNHYSIQRPNGQQLIGTTRFNDLNGKPTILLQMEIPRLIYKQASATLKSVLLSILIGGLLLGLALLIVIETSVLSKISRLKTQILEIETSANLQLRMPVLGRDELGVLANSMNKMLAVLESSKNAVKLLLDNSGQGFFSFDQSGKIGPECSKITTDIWRVTPDQMHIGQMLQKSEEYISTNLELVFGGLLPFRDAIEFLPKTITVHERLIELQYREIKRSDDTTERIMVIATDKTELYQLQAQQEQERILNLALLKILNNKNDFIDTLAIADNLAVQIHDIVQFKRTLHTLKGGMAFFECRAIAELCHHHENLLSEDPSPTSCQRATKEIAVAIQDFVREHNTVLGITTSNDERTVTIPVKRIEKLIEMAMAMHLPNVALELEHLLERNANECFSSLNHAFLSTAEKMGKEVQPIDWKTNTTINPLPYCDLFKSLIHIVRNAADHGIEDANEREMLGKPRQGHLWADLKLENGIYQLIFSDDGGGIDLQKLRQRAQALPSASNLTDEEALNLIFENSFSTKEAVTQTSGRGIGLDAVRAEAKRLGGGIKVESKLGAGTTFTIWFPKHSLTSPLSSAQAA